MSYRLLSEFENLFRGQPYLHRNPQLGDWVAIHLYEDLFELDRSRKFVEGVASGSRVINSTNKIQGIRSRRGDGTFGETVPGETPIFDPGYHVGRSLIATVEIGVEVKILAKSMIKQIDRVCNDLRNQAHQFRRAGGQPITLGIVGINHAERYVSYEGDRQYETGRSGHPHPVQEAAQAEIRLRRDAASQYGHFLVLRFKAINAEPYPFEWLNVTATERDYGAILVRISGEYDQRF